MVAAVIIGVFLGSIANTWGVGSRNALILGALPLIVSIVLSAPVRLGVRNVAIVAALLVAFLFWRGTNSVPAYIENKADIIQKRYALLVRGTDEESEYAKKWVESFNNYVDHRIRGVRSNVGWLIVYHDLVEQDRVLERELRARNRDTLETASVQ